MKKKKSELVYVKMSTTLFPNRILDLPNPLAQFVMVNPRVKVVWDNERGYYSINDSFNNIDERIILTMTSYPKRIK